MPVAGVNQLQSAGIVSVSDLHGHAGGVNTDETHPWLHASGITTIILIEEAVITTIHLNPQPAAEGRSGLLPVEADCRRRPRAQGGTTETGILIQSDHLDVTLETTNIIIITSPHTTTAVGGKGTGGQIPEGATTDHHLTEHPGERMSKKGKCCRFFL